MSKIDQSLVRFKINASNDKIKKTISSFSVHLILDKSDEIVSTSKTIQNLKESTILIIKYIENIQKENNFFIIGFKNTIFLINESLLKSLQNNFILFNSNLPIYFLHDTKSIFNLNIKVPNKQIEIDDQFSEEINSFNKQITIFPTINFNNQICHAISSCITGYLIQESYTKASLRLDLYDQIMKLLDEQQENSNIIGHCIKDDYVVLRVLGIGVESTVKLIYHLDKGELFVLKKQNNKYNKKLCLTDEENKNITNKKLFHPLMSSYCGIVQDKNYLIANFIEGQRLSDILNTKESGKKLNLTFEDKIAIIILITCIFEHLFYHDYIYRDLNPDNVIINHNKIAFIVDFKRMVNTDDYKNKADFKSVFMAPEVKYGRVNADNDVYSIGQMIYFIMNEKMPPRKWDKTKFFRQNPILYDIYKKCTEKNPNKRPTIRQLIGFIGRPYYEQLKAYFKRNEKLANNIDSIFENEIAKRAIVRLAGNLIAGIFTHTDYKTAIHLLSIAADHDDLDAQYDLGRIFYEGRIVERNINISIYYFKKAAEKNHVESQCFLGQIYSEGKYISKDIDKSVYYYSLAAKQNYSESLLKLGMLFKKDFDVRDIYKAIRYLTSAANQNKIKAQLELGKLYLEDEKIKDIKKAIYYLTLASENKCAEAQFLLGIIYYEKKYNNTNIDKAIHYLQLASKQRHADAQYYLGVIYSGVIIYEKKNLKLSIKYFLQAAEQDHSESLNKLGEYYFNNENNINKAIHYYLLASKQGNSKAQLNLALIYLKGEQHIKQDINKAIHYFQLAAKFNSDAQNYLGRIYYEGKYITKDIDKSIYYYKLASEHNNREAQYNLGKIYLSDQFVDQKKKEGIILLIRSSINLCDEASFMVGFIYHEGKLIKQDIKESIYYYKNASSFNNTYAKNNLGIIYKNGMGDIIQQNNCFAITFFKEAIKIKNDPVSMYNLASIYIFNEEMKEKIDESIDLLIKSSNLEFKHSNDLLCIVLIKKHGLNLAKIKQDLIDKTAESDLPEKICEIAERFVNNKLSFDQFYQEIKEKDYLYDYHYNYFPSKDLKIDEGSTEIKYNLKAITPDFYEGFGDDI